LTNAAVGRGSPDDNPFPLDFSEEPNREFRADFLGAEISLHEDASGENTPRFGKERAELSRAKSGGCAPIGCGLKKSERDCEF
jgi:hypothetical protein